MPSSTFLRSPRPEHDRLRSRSRLRGVSALVAVLAVATLVPLDLSAAGASATSPSGGVSGSAGVVATGGLAIPAGPLGHRLAQVTQDPRIDPDLWSVPTDGARVRAAAAKLERTRAELADARRRRDDNAAALVELNAAEQRLSGRLVQAERRRAKSHARLGEFDEGLRGLIVAEYLRGGTGSSLDPDVDLADLSRNRSRRVLVATSLEQRLSDVSANREAMAAADELAAVTVLEREEVRRRIAATTAARDQAVADEARLVVTEAEDTQALADARVTAPVVGADFTLVVLDAYVKGARQMAEIDPACSIHWSLLAGIGRTESMHGTFGGTEVGADGRTLEPILGIALDGTRSAAISDTDGGLLDMDPVWDRAVGPMQFIPSTWAASGRDGNGDGEADPHNLYDTALAAAAYLCRASRDLLSEEGARRGLWSYNLDHDYATIVLERASGYRALGLLPGD